MVASSFREKLLAEAFAERERILDTVRAQLAEVDAVIASLHGEVPPDALYVELGPDYEPPPPEPPQVAERAAEQAREEKPPSLAEEAQAPKPEERAAPGVRGDQIVAYLTEHGPSLRRDIVTAIGIQGNTAARAFRKLEHEERVLKADGPAARGGQRHTVFYLPGQDPSSLQESPADATAERDERIIAFIRENGPTLRTGINKALGIPRGSWGTLTPRLIEKGLATFEVPAPQGGNTLVGMMLPGQTVPMGGRMTAAASPVTTKHVDPTTLKPPPESKPPPPKATAPEDGRKLDNGGPERFPEMLRHMPSAEKNVPTKSLRAVLEFERKVLMTLVDGPKLSVIIADELGDRSQNAHNAKVRQYLVNASETGHVERTGEGYPPWANGGGAYKGRSSIEYGITEKGRAALRGESWTESETETRPLPSTTSIDPTSVPSLPPPSSPTEPPRQEPSVSEPSVGPSVSAKLESLRKTKVPSYQDVRDAWVMLPGMMMSPGQLLKELELNWPIAIVGAFMEQGAAEGKLTDKSPPGGELRIFQYDPPEGPGKAAQIDIDRPPEVQAASGSGRGAPVAGTGSQPLPPNPDAAALVRDIRKAGGLCDPVGSGHWKVVNTETRQSVRISGTPGNPRTVKNDRKRVKRIGIDV